MQGGLEEHILTLCISVEHTDLSSLLRERHIGYLCVVRKHICIVWAVDVLALKLEFVREDKFTFFEALQHV